jgi:hypothetical protein
MHQEVKILIAFERLPRGELVAVSARVFVAMPYSQRVTAYVIITNHGQCSR